MPGATRWCALPEGAGAARLLLSTIWTGRRKKEEVRGDLALRPAEGVTLELLPG